MSLFFEDEIRKVMGKANPSGMDEIMSQDPRRNGLVSNHTRRSEDVDKTLRNQNTRRRPRWI
ncbi:hypothetical protein [Sporosarcina highlanderae]|uniref:Uncharacterized protein n=1 Tax=Sporosarcina highlanderae TaxID=3035916 RepID=A0ABT8JN81_9BACL|nr:hypothetical protein [Sporosarcina highlanderae]MDN4606606.1 hypothetical protein [Sporosarcina highlanderae]